MVLNLKELVCDMLKLVLIACCYALYFTNFYYLFWNVGVYQATELLNVLAYISLFLWFHISIWIIYKFFSFAINDKKSQK